MAPSGAWSRLGGWAFSWMLAVWLLWGRAFADVGAITPTLSNCTTIDDEFDSSLNGTQGDPLTSIVRLGAGCRTLFHNHVCVPISSPLTVEGEAGGGSVWDARFDLFQFSVEPGVVLTLRNLVLARALVFAVGYANMQPALFHMRPGSRLVLENVTLMTLCSTTVSYWTLEAYASQQPTDHSSAPAGQPLYIADMTVGNVTLRGVTLACDPAQAPPGQAVLYVHGAQMLTSFATASNALALSADITLMENITLPYIAASVNPEQPNPRVALISINTVITGAVGKRLADNGTAAAPLTYVDANYTMSWFYVSPPARLTLKGLVLTRLRSAIWAPGVLNTGVMAGALPMFMIQTPAGPADSAVRTLRLFEDSTLLLPQFEVSQISYWCKMLGVMAPELSSVSDFLRPLVWVSECDVLEASRLMLQRVSSTVSQYTRVLVTSVAPPGVPFDPNMAPPAGSIAYEHVNPPLYLAYSGAEWADAIAPVLPQDTWTSPPPPPTAAEGTSATAITLSSPTAAGAAAAAETSLPSLILLDGTVRLTAADVAVPGGGRRVIRRSAVISSMRRFCGPDLDSEGEDGACPAPAVLDFGGMRDVMRLEGSNVTVLFQGVTLRNISTTLALGMAASANSLRSFFVFDRTSVRIIYDTVTVELAAAEFAILHAYLINPPDRMRLPGGVVIRSMNTTYISMASFSLAGARGSNVEFKVLSSASAGGNSGTPSQPGDSSSSSGAVSAAGRSGGSRTNTAVVVGASVGAAVVAAVLALVLCLYIHRRRASRRTAEEGSGTAAGGKVEKVAAEDRGRGSSDGDDLPRRPPSGDDQAAAAAGALQLACGHRKALLDEESAICTTTGGTVSAVTSASDSGLPPSLPPPPLPAVAGTGGLNGVGASALSGAATFGTAAGSSGLPARRAFSLARSVPEDDLLDEPEVVRPCSSSRVEHASAGSGSCSGRFMSGGGAGAGGPGVIGAARRSLDPPAGDGSVPGPADSMLDPPTTSGVTAAAAVAAVAASCSTGSGSGGGGRSSTGAGASSSSSSSRRMARALSSGRPHGMLLGDSALRPSLRVRALGRSPSRPSRSAVSSLSNGPSGTLPAPAPAVLMTPELCRRLGIAQPPPTAPSVAVGMTVAGVLSSACQGGDTASGSSARTAPLPCSTARNPAACVQRREGSQGAIMSGRELSSRHGDANTLADDPPQPLSLGPAAASVPVAAAIGVARTARLMGAGVVSGGDPQSHTSGEPDSGSPGASNSIVKVPEPASEVQRLISEMAAQGTDQLVILEPIGQGGYGTVFRGVWRNLDVAVKTVLFQDRANLTPAPTPGPGTASLTQCHVVRTAMLEQQSEEQETHTPPVSLNTSPHPCAASLFPNPLAALGGATPTPTSSSCCVAGAGGTHNWILASQHAANNNNSGSLPSVNMGGAAAAAAAAACGPLGVASQQRAVLEAAVSCSVAHPNVVATYHYDITSVRPSGVVCSGGLLVSDALRGYGAGGGAPSDWKLYLVQEFCDGGSLAAALDARFFHDQAGMPNLALMLCALADIARGMSHIHSRSIVHGDLNPTNILLRTISGSNGSIVPMWNRVAAGGGAGGPGAPAGGGGGSGSTTPGGSLTAAATLRNELGVTMVAKVADFGLCGLLAPGKRHISNAMRGTPFYTAPETVATGTLTKASDVYSFGVIAWEVYTGRPPFQHVPGQGFVRDESFPRLPPHVPPTFANLTLGCLNADPDTRPTFEQILDRLMSLQSKLAVSLQQRLSRLVASNGVVLGTGATSPPFGMSPFASTSPQGSLTMPPPPHHHHHHHATAPAGLGTSAASSNTAAGTAATAGVPAYRVIGGGGGGDGGGGVVGGGLSGSGSGGGGMFSYSPSPMGMPYGSGSQSMSALPSGATATAPGAGVAAGMMGVGGSAVLAPGSGLMGTMGMGIPSGMAFANSMPNIQPMDSAQPTLAALVARQ